MKIFQDIVNTLVVLVGLVAIIRGDYPAATCFLLLGILGEINNLKRDLWAEDMSGAKL